MKQQPLKRKQEPVQATASTESAETYTSDGRGDNNDGDANRKQRKIVRWYHRYIIISMDGMTIVTYPLDLHGMKMKMNPNLNVSYALKNRYFQ